MAAKIYYSISDICFATPNVFGVKWEDMLIEFDSGSNEWYNIYTTSGTIRYKFSSKKIS